MFRTNRMLDPHIFPVSQSTIYSRNKHVMEAKNVKIIVWVQQTNRFQMINEAPMVRGLAANKFTKHNTLYA